ncbi:conjugal transfer protein TraC [Salmonella enterica subsp. enterica serovar Java]|nr:conjugal transfer protein TraC [Salmonella enterica]ECE8552337.1 conjugal transfer protein TraC [Salmonella enterica subsp. enterica serovar Java]
MQKTKTFVSKVKMLACAFFISVLTSAPMSAFAAGGVSGAEGGISTAQTAIYSLLGAGAAVYLLIKGFMLKINKIGWNDLFMAMVTCAVVAGLPALAVWFWDLGGN